jgi:sporulation protein YlmC with PRC-barrel domain
MNKMKRSTLISSLATSVGLFFAGQVLAAEAVATGAVSASSPDGMTVPSTKPGLKCLQDLRDFTSQMGKDGYWLGGSLYGYGYPVGEFGYGYDGYADSSRPESAEGRYQNARPGYEVRSLVTTANILARHGQQQLCESLLAKTRELYKTYVADQHNLKAPLSNTPEWQKRQIASAQSVTDHNIAFRSEALLGTEVLNSRGIHLGSVDDIVTSPQTGQIAYLVIGRGGIFGIDEKYVPVPWGDFKVTTNVSLLVLDATKPAMDAAPQVKRDQQFNAAGAFDQESKTVDAYWNTALSKQGQ